MDLDLSPVHTSNNVEATFDFVATNGNNVEATFDTVERTVQLVAFDNVASMDGALRLRADSIP